MTTASKTNYDGTEDEVTDAEGLAAAAKKSGDDDPAVAVEQAVGSHNTIDTSTAPTIDVTRAGIRSLLIAWDGVEAVHGHGYYEAQIDTDSAFGSPDDFYKGKSTFTVFDGLTTGTTYYARVRAVDAAGNTGPWSTGTAGQTTDEADTGDLADDSVTAIKIAALTANDVVVGANSSDTTGVIRSSNFSSGSSGWRIRGNGDAEFNDVTVRGTLITLGTASGDSFRATNDDGYVKLEIDSGSTGTYSVAGYLSTQSSGVALVSNQYDPSASRTGSSWSATGILVEDDYLRMQLYNTAASDVRCRFEFDLNDQIAMRGDGGVLVTGGERIRIQTDVGFDVVVAADALDVNAALEVSGNLGLFGTAATSKQTVSGSRGGNAALQSLLTALAAYGLITDSTT